MTNPYAAPVEKCPRRKEDRVSKPRNPARFLLVPIGVLLLLSAGGAVTQILDPPGGKFVEIICICSFCAILGATAAFVGLVRYSRLTWIGTIGWSSLALASMAVAFVVDPPYGELDTLAFWISISLLLSIFLLAVGFPPKKNAPATTFGDPEKDELLDHQAT